MMARTTHPERVAIVGSGMAGLTTAMLLNGDPQRRYSVTVFESVSLQVPPVFSSCFNIHNSSGGQDFSRCGFNYRQGSCDWTIRKGGCTHAGLRRRLL